MVNLAVLLGCAPCAVVEFCLNRQIVGACASRCEGVSSYMKAVDYYQLTIQPPVAQTSVPVVGVVDNSDGRDEGFQAVEETNTTSDDYQTIVSSGFAEDGTGLKSSSAIETFSLLQLIGFYSPDEASIMFGISYPSNTHTSELLAESTTTATNSSVSPSASTLAIVTPSPDTTPSISEATTRTRSQQLMQAYLDFFEITVPNTLECISNWKDWLSYRLDDIYNWLNSSSICTDIGGPVNLLYAALFIACTAYAVLYNNCQKAYYDLEDQHLALDNNHKTSQEERIALEKKLDDLIEQLCGLAADHEKLEGYNKRLRGQLYTATAANSSLRAQVDVLKTQQRAIQQKADAFDKRYEMLRTQKAAVATTIVDVSADGVNELWSFVQFVCSRPRSSTRKRTSDLSGMTWAWMQILSRNSVIATDGSSSDDDADADEWEPDHTFAGMLGGYSLTRAGSHAESEGEDQDAGFNIVGTLGGYTLKRARQASESGSEVDGQAGEPDDDDACSTAWTDACDSVDGDQGVEDRESELERALGDTINENGMHNLHWSDGAVHVDEKSGSSERVIVEFGYDVEEMPVWDAADESDQDVEVEQEDRVMYEAEVMSEDAVEEVFESEVVEKGTEEPQPATQCDNDADDESNDGGQSNDDETDGGINEDVHESSDLVLEASEDLVQANSTEPMAEPRLVVRADEGATADHQRVAVEVAEATDVSTDASEQIAAAITDTRVLSSTDTPTTHESSQGIELVPIPAVPLPCTLASPRGSFSSASSTLTKDSTEPPAAISPTNATKSRTASITSSSTTSSKAAIGTEMPWRRFMPFGLHRAAGTVSLTAVPPSTITTSVAWAGRQRDAERETPRSAVMSSIMRRP